MSILPTNVETFLAELAQWLEFKGTQPVELLVCGGIAMTLQGLHQRATTDVDVIGVRERGQLVWIAQFSQDVQWAIQQVADNHPELQYTAKSWVNLGPADLAKQGLPAGFESRSVVRQFGKTLTLRLLGRTDLIALKLDAASDRFSTRQEIHQSDLKRLNGTFQELDAAIDWMRRLPRFDEMRPEIQSVLERLGFDDLAQYV